MTADSTDHIHAPDSRSEPAALEHRILTALLQDRGSYEWYLLPDEERCSTAERSRPGSPFSEVRVVQG